MSLIVTITTVGAIGARNAFVLRQGVRPQHVLTVAAVAAICAICVICATSDAVLIGAGVGGLGLCTL